MILVDSNIPMYVVGHDDAMRDRARAVLESAVAEGTRLVTDAEVFQEILHRYVAIDRREAIEPAFTLLRAVVDEVVPVTLEVADEARGIVLSQAGMSARDAVHVAVMRLAGIRRIMSFDRGFDAVSGIERVG